MFAARPRSDSSQERNSSTSSGSVDAPAQSPARSRRSASSSPTTDLASVMRPDATHSMASPSGDGEDLGVLLLGPVRCPVDRHAVGGEEDRRHRVGHPGARIDRRRAARACPAAARPPRRAPAAAVTSSGSPATSRIARRDLDRPRSIAGAGTGATSTTDGCSRRRRARGRRRRPPASARRRARTSSRRVPRTWRRRCSRRDQCGRCARRGGGTRSPASTSFIRASASDGASPAAWPNAVEERSHAAGVAGTQSTSPRHGTAATMLQGCGDQLAEQRVRAVRAALELGVGLRADPVAGGRRAR